MPWFEAHRDSLGGPGVRAQDCSHIGALRRSRRKGLRHVRLCDARMSRGDLSYAVLRHRLVKGCVESLRIPLKHRDTFVVHLDGVGACEHLGHIHVLLTVFLRVQLDAPLDQALRLFRLTQLDQQVCVLIHDECVVWEPSNALVVKADSGLEL
eukprot:CAMPEP_0170459324 /NCGR_PEP_ID=MMETSP0123-20130129/6063_1 /TAXON_ID=182087 /ORGANISM="Favella ehrenbergii, Strain Fehren 1" /LENGTH=152 /DNA_ID=CAMNT_0010723897 /DNA_START=548 /DNA_END=1007 /DNA_ORIENTATION=+